MSCGADGETKMPMSEFKARAVRKKTREVANYHRDTAFPGKPLHMVIPGGLMALACLGAIIVAAHQTWLEHNWDESRGIGTLALLIPVGVIVGVLAALVFESSNSSDSKSNSKSSKGSSSGSSGDSLLASLFSSVGSSGTRSTFAPTNIDLSFPTVINEAATVAAAEPPPPESIVCTFRKAEYIPEQTEFTCPYVFPT